MLDAKATLSKAGDRRIVFDAALWAGCDVGDNSRFWRPATILKIYSRGGDSLADVRFSDGRVSKGHFVKAMREVAS